MYCNLPTAFRQSNLAAAMGAILIGLSLGAAAAVAQVPSGGVVLEPGLRNILRLKKKKSSAAADKPAAAQPDPATATTEASPAAAPAPVQGEPVQQPAPAPDQATLPESAGTPATGSIGSTLKKLGRFPSLPGRKRKSNSDPADQPAETTVENDRLAYAAVARVASVVAAELACKGQTIAFYQKTQPEELLTLRAFTDQLNTLASRMKTIAELSMPTAPTGTVGSVSSSFSPGSLPGPVLQPVHDLVSILRTGTALGPESSLDDTGIMTSVAKAAIQTGCSVYWPEQYVASPFNSTSPIMRTIQQMADTFDNGMAAGKPAGLQQRAAALAAELRRAENRVADLQRSIDIDNEKLGLASSRVNSLRDRLDWISKHVTNARDPQLQSKLNTSFNSSWDELERAIRRQLALDVPQTIEGQDRLSEMLKKLDLLKDRTDKLAEYVKDTKDVALQEQLKNAMASVWHDLDAAEGALLAMSSSVPQSNFTVRDQKYVWDRYVADLKSLIAVTTAATDGYSTFRQALLQGGKAPSPLNRMLRAESMRDLAFDERFQAKTGATIVQVKIQKLGGSSRVVKNSVFDTKEGFSGGVVLSYVQYEPNGKIRRSGVHSAYRGLQNQLFESQP